MRVAARGETGVELGAESVRADRAGAESFPDGQCMDSREPEHAFHPQRSEAFHREVTADVTDDGAMVEALGAPVKLFAGSRTNLKITTVEDLEIVQALLEGKITSSLRG